MINLKESFTDKSPVQKAINEYRGYLPKAFTNNLATEFGFTPNYVRQVWQGKRVNVDIMNTTLEAIESAKKTKAELDKKISAIA